MLTFNNFTAGGGGGGGITGTGTPPRLPVWLTPTSLGDSQFEQFDQWNWKCFSPYGGFETTDDNNPGGYFYTQSQTPSTGNYDWNFSLFTNNQAFDALFLTCNMSPLAGGSYSAGLRFIGWTGNTPQRNFQLVNDGAAFLQHFRVNQNTQILVFDDGSTTPTTNDCYTLYVGGERRFNYGIGAPTSPGLVFANQWLQYQPLMYTAYNFSASNIVGTQVLQTKFFTSGGSFNLIQAGGGIRTYSGLQIFHSFNNVGAATISHLSGIQILGLYPISNNINIATIGEWYALLINDSDEYTAGNIVVTGNRYAIYQAGVNDKNIFFGNMGFYGTAPVVQQNTGIAAAAWVHNAGGTNIKDVDTILGYTLAQVVQALKNYGLLA